MTVPNENTTVDDGVAAEVTPSIATGDLDTDRICDFDGSRMETWERRTVGNTTYDVRQCSGNPNHTKMIPV